MPLKYLIPAALILALSSLSSMAQINDQGGQISRMRTDNRKEGRFSNMPDLRTESGQNDLRLGHYPEEYDGAGKEPADSIEKAQALINKGLEYCDQYRYNLAMESYLEAKRLAESIDSPQLSAQVYHVIGRLHLEMRNIDLARGFLSLAVEIREKYGRTEETAASLNSLALVLWLQGELDSALNYLFNSLTIEKNLGNKDGISRAYNNIGIVYHEKKEFETSLSYLFQALELSEQEHDRWSVAEACNNIGEVSISMGSFHQAEKYLEKARRTAEEINATLLLADNYRYMARLYKRTGRFEKALDYFERFNNLNDSLFNRSTYTIVSELTSLFEIEKREQSILVQNQKIEILQAKRKNDRLLNIILAGIIFFIITTGVIIINRQRRIEARNKLLIEKDRLIQETQALLMANEKAEKERLVLELENKNRFLIDFALYIGMKNELLFTIRDEIRKSARKTGNPQEFRHLLYQINQNLRYNKELVDLQKNVERVNFEFIRTLMDRFPGLTENEKHLAILLRLNFSTKEIADLRAVSIKGVEMSRYRLRKKMDIDDKENLTHYIQRI